MTVVTFDLIEKISEVIEIEHGFDVTSMNICAVIEGKLCDCEWCLKLRERINSRTCHQFGLR